MVGTRRHIAPAKTWLRPDTGCLRVCRDAILANFEDFTNFKGVSIECEFQLLARSMHVAVRVFFCGERRCQVKKNIGVYMVN